VGGKVPLAALIPQLKILKLPRTLFTGLARPDRLGASAREVIASMIVRVDPDQEACVQILILTRGTVLSGVLASHVQYLLSVAPLSKFGLSVTCNVIPESDWRSESFLSEVATTTWYSYEKGTFNYYQREFLATGMRTAIEECATSIPKKYPIIFSTLAVRIDTGLPD
jgi:hypothetical protein